MSDSPTLQCSKCNEIFEYGNAKKLTYILDKEYKRNYIKVKSMTKNETIDLWCPKCSEILSIVFLPAMLGNKVKFSVKGNTPMWNPNEHSLRGLKGQRSGRFNQ